jgi:hypothetical protein
MNARPEMDCGIWVTCAEITGPTTTRECDPMGLEISERFYSHEAVVMLDPGSLGVWIRAASWSAHHMTEGRIPKAILDEWWGHEEGADGAYVALVRAGLWVLTDDGNAYTMDNPDYIWSMDDECL